MPLAKQHPVQLCAVLLVLLCSPVLGGDIVKWVDEEGKVHYGDRVPAKYQQQAEKVDAEAPLLGLSKEEIKAQQRATAEYERQVEINRRAENQKKEKRSFSPPQTKPRKNSMTREDCRNAHPSITADRVRCFKAIEASKAED